MSAKSSSLTELQNAHLHLAVEVDPGKAFKDIAKTDREYFGGENKDNFRWRFNYLRRIKNKDPGRYWQLYSQAQKLVEEEKNKDTSKGYRDRSQDSDDDEDYSVSDQSTSSTENRPPKRKSPSRTKPEPPKKYKTSMPSSSKSTASISSFSGGASSTASCGAGSNEPPLVKFETLDDAIEFSDDTYYVDLDNPEKNGGPLFFVNHVTEVKNSSGTELITKMRILLSNITDLRDFSKCQGLVVLKGAAFMVSMPSVAAYLLEDFMALFKKERIRCKRTEQAHKVHRNNIIKDVSRQLKHVLFVFPEGMICTGLLDSDVPPVLDQKVKLTLREAEAQFFRTGKKQKKYKQSYFPGYWNLRILTGERRFLTLPEAEGIDDLDEAFAGMNMQADDGSFSSGEENSDSEGSDSESSESESEDEDDDELMSDN